MSFADKRQEKNRVVTLASNDLIRGRFMAHMRTLAGLPRLVLFLKATTRKRVFVPTFTRSDGSVVQGHYAMVHVADDHNDHRVLAGHGSHSQKQAHAALSRESWFHALPHEHQANVLLEHATGIQEKASAAARLSTFRKKMLAGERPTAGELRAFDAVPEDRQRAVVADIRAAGKLDALPERYREMAAPEPRAPAAKKTARAAPAKASSSVAEHVAAIQSARLPASNVNAKVVNLKLDAIAAALKSGEADLLTMMSYGSNNYGVKAAKLANAALGLLGSSERVSPGQKGTPGFRTDAQIAAAKKRAHAERTVDPSRDSLMTAMAKLGGVKKSSAMQQWGYGANDLKGYFVGIKPVFSSRGLSIERMGEALHELGYLKSDEHGRFDGRELEEHVSDGLGGGHHFTPQGYANDAQADHEEQYQGLGESDVAASGFDALPEEAQQQIEEFLDENPDFTPEEIESFERIERLADEDDVPFEPLDFGTTGGRHRDFGQAHAGPGGSDVPF
jgi:hypothetical protein